MMRPLALLELDEASARSLDLPVRTTRLLAHDEAGQAREGDTVTISQCRPVSRRKSWRLVEVVLRGSAI